MQTCHWPCLYILNVILTGIYCRSSPSLVSLWLMQLHVSGVTSPPHRSGHLCKIMLYITHVIVKCNLKYFSMLTVLVWCFLIHTLLLNCFYWHNEHLKIQLQLNAASFSTSYNLPFYQSRLLLQWKVMFCTENLQTQNCIEMIKYAPPSPTKKDSITCINIVLFFD